MGTWNRLVYPKKKRGQNTKYADVFKEPVLLYLLGASCISRGQIKRIDRKKSRSRNINGRILISNSLIII